MTTHDLSIANDTMPNVRSDLNSALQALGSQQAGTSDPATMYAYERQARTDLGIVRRRNAANTGWLTDGSLAETFVVARGSNTILAQADFSRLFRATAAFTQTLTAAATLGDGWWCGYNAAGYSIVLDPNGAETIDGSATKTITGSGFIFCDGTGFYTVGFYKGIRDLASDVVVALGSAGNQYLQINGGTSSGVTLEATDATSGGAGVNPNLYLSSGGTGAVYILTNNSACVQGRFTHTASAVNYLDFSGSATGSAVTISATGTDTNIDIAYAAKGSGRHLFTSASGVPQLAVTSTAGAANYVAITGGTNPRVYASGNNLIFGSGAAVATSAITGHIMIPSCAGVPTGAVTGAGAGAIPFLYDSTNNKLMTLNGGTWRGVTLT